LLPDKTFEFKDVKCHGGKQSKDRLTVHVCANMSGTDKLPMFVIGKSKNPRFKNVKSFAKTVVIDGRDGGSSSSLSLSSLLCCLDEMMSSTSFFYMNTVNRFIMNEHVLSLCTKQSDISSFFTQADSSSKQD
jgi:hypothetical protein